MPEPDPLRSALGAAELAGEIGSKSAMLRAKALNKRSYIRPCEMVADDAVANRFAVQCQPVAVIQYATKGSCRPPSHPSFQMTLRTQ